MSDIICMLRCIDPPTDYISILASSQHTIVSAESKDTMLWGKTREGRGSWESNSEPLAQTADAVNTKQPVDLIVRATGCLVLA